MKVTINNEEKDIISFVRDVMKLKKLTIGIDITDEIQTIDGGKVVNTEQASFTMVLASPDNSWTRPIFVRGKVADAYTLIMKALTEAPKLEEKVTNSKEVAEDTAKDAAKKALSTKQKAEAVSKSKKVEKKVPVIDWTDCDKYLEKKDWLRAKYCVNVTLRTKHAKDPDAIALIDAKVKEIEELSKPAELFTEAPVEKATIKEIAEASPNVILATLPKTETEITGEPIIEPKNPNEETEALEQ